MLKTKRLLLPIILILCLTLTISGYSADLFGTYDQRIKFTIDHTKIDSELTWFPVTLHFTDSQAEEIFAEFDADEDFDRCAITTSDEATQIYGDCEAFDDSEQIATYHVSKTGWAIDPDTDTDGYFYYDNDADHNTDYISKSGGTAGQSVWDSNYKAVYHMNDADIDVGVAAINRDTGTGTDCTYVNKGNPCNVDGVIRKVDLWFTVNATGVKVFTCSADGNDLTSRDIETIGNVTAGSKQTFVVSLEVKAGDYIGVYWNAGSFEFDTTGGEGIWEKAGDNSACSSTEFTLQSTRACSLYGCGYDILDSTSNGNHGLKKAAGEPVEAAGQVGQGQHFDGSDDYITTPTLLDVVPANGTISIFLTPDDTSEAEAKYLWYKKNDADNRLRCYWLAAADEGSRFVGFEKYNATVSKSCTSTTSLTNTYYLITATWGSTGMVLYLDGVSEDTDPDTNAIVNGTLNDFTIGSSYTLGTYVWDGVIDELRVSSVQRNVSWTKAENASLRDTLFTYGDEETEEEEEGANVLFIFSDF